MMSMTPKLYSYVIARDYGFAPNPFYGFCTLATCKPNIRKSAALGDWVVGTGSKSKGRHEYIVYAMRVSEAISFEQYWQDSRFRQKRPRLYGSLKQAFGDNIYHWCPDTEEWLQMDSHHSYEYGARNPDNINNDTGVDRVLISSDFVYWGGDGPKLPDFLGQSICKKGIGHKANFSYKVVEEFVNWLRDLGVNGYCGNPLDWKDL